MITREQESAAKVVLVRALLEERGVAGVLVQKQANFSWLTAGARGFIGLASEAACGSLLVTWDGVYLAANNIEAGRLIREELPQGLAQPLEKNWQQDGELPALIAAQCGGRLLTDSELEPWFKERRTSLTEGEIQRFADTGRATAQVLERVCRSLLPGVSELEVAGKISQGLWAAGIEPITLLVAADDRSEQVRHYVPTSKKAKTGVIASLCARKGGLVVSATRSVGFSRQFAQRHGKLLQVEQAAFAATATCATVGEAFQRICEAYAANGLPREWENHHQGGMTGYLAREVRATRETDVPIRANQAYAWNPSAAGAKCEDTVLYTGKDIQLLTPCGSDWPTVRQGGLLRPDVLYK